MKMRKWIEENIDLVLLIAMLSLLVFGISYCNHKDGEVSRTYTYVSGEAQIDSQLEDGEFVTPILFEDGTYANNVGRHMEAGTKFCKKYTYVVNSWGNDTKRSKITIGNCPEDDSRSESSDRTLPTEVVQEDE